MYDCEANHTVSRNIHRKRSSTSTGQLSIVGCVWRNAGARILIRGMWPLRDVSTPAWRSMDFRFVAAVIGFSSSSRITLDRVRFKDTYKDHNCLSSFMHYVNTEKILCTFYIDCRCNNSDNCDKFIAYFYCKERDYF